jgi:hypothetical protein
LTAGQPHAARRCNDELEEQMLYSLLLFDTDEGISKQYAEKDFCEMERNFNSVCFNLLLRVPETNRSPEGERCKSGSPDFI